MKDIKVFKAVVKGILGAALVSVIAIFLLGCSADPGGVRCEWPSGDGCEVAFDGTLGEYCN